MTENDSGRPDWVDEAVRLTRIGMSGNDEAREKRNRIAEQNGYVPRERDDGVLVLHPEDWIEDGVVDLDAFDADDAYEIPLDGRGFEEAREANDAVVEEFATGTETDEADVFNARSFCEFCENHHSVAIENATAEQVDEFINEYYVRNVWASQEAERRLESSLEKLFEFVGRKDLIDTTQATK